MKIAILGASSIAAKVLPIIRSLPMLELIGIASSDSVRGASFAREYDVKFLGDYNDVYKDKKIDAVYITTVNSEHARCIENSLLSGKHVLCEKPLVLSLAASTKLFDLSKKMNLTLLEGLMYRFHPQIQEIVKRVHSGEIGSPKRINATFSFDYGSGPHLERRLKNGGGALPDLGCYLIDFANLISRGSPVTKLQKIENQSPSSFGVTLYLANGMLVELRSAMNSPSINTWEVICEKGSISVNRYNPHESSESTIQIVNDESELTCIHISKSGSGLDQFAREFQNFYDLIVNKTQPFITPNESKYNATVMELIQSANEAI